jgi:hypothetical protein
MTFTNDFRIFKESERKILFRCGGEKEAAKVKPGVVMRVNTFNEKSCAFYKLNVASECREPFSGYLGHTLLNVKRC